MSKLFNKSRTYLLPLLVNKYRLNILKIHNTYLYTSEDFEKNKLHVECIFEDEQDMINFEKLFKQDIDTISKFILDKGRHIRVLYSFSLDREHYETYHCFLIGKYSKITNVDKNIIKMFWHKAYKGTNNEFLLKVKQILDRSDLLKKEIEENLKVTLPDEAELSSSINVEDEIYYGD